MGSKGQVRQTVIKTLNLESPKESPKSPLKIAPVDKSKIKARRECGRGGIICRNIARGTEVNSFKEEMKALLGETDKTISTNVAAIVRRF